MGSIFGRSRQSGKIKVNVPENCSFRGDMSCDCGPAYSFILSSHLLKVPKKKEKAHFGREVSWIRKKLKENFTCGEKLSADFTSLCTFPRSRSKSSGMNSSLSSRRIIHTFVVIEKCIKCETLAFSLPSNSVKTFEDCTSCDSVIFSGVLLMEFYAETRSIWHACCCCWELFRMVSQDVSVLLTVTKSCTHFKRQSWTLAEGTFPKTIKQWLESELKVEQNKAAWVRIILHHH